MKNYAPSNKPGSPASQRQTVIVNDIVMYYERYGSGRPLLLLHGFGGCSQNWQPFIPELSKYFQTIVVDLRGHGYSTDPQNKFTHKQAACDLFVLLEEIGITNFSAMGMSTGGMILLHMATQQPVRIESMVLISATTHFPPQARTIMQRSSFETMPPEVRAMYTECAKRGEGQIRQLISRFNSFYDDENDVNFAEKTLSRITSKTLIIHGENDIFFPAEIARTMHHFIPGSKLWVIPGGEHVPVFDPGVPFTVVALEFLKEYYQN